MKRYREFELRHFSDERGETVPLEFCDEFPFEVKRIYWITGNSEAVRGGHAHKKEEEVFVAVSGSVLAKIHNGEEEKEILLDAKNKALYVAEYCWHEFTDFSPDAVLLCLSSTHYSGRDEYIEDKEEFLQK